MLRNFVHIPKNAGTAVLNNMTVKRSGPAVFNADELIVQTALNKFGMRLSYMHIRAKDNLNIILRKEPSLAVVRNPWAREFSKYKFLMAQTLVIDNKDSDRRRALVARYNCSATDLGWKNGFKNYLEMRHEFKDQPWTWLHACETFWTQRSYLVIDNKIPDNMLVVRQEQLEEDMKEFGLASRISKTNASPSSLDYVDVYDPESYKIVGDMYKEDIDYWGFDFDNSAVRNIG